MGGSRRRSGSSYGAAGARAVEVIVPSFILSWRPSRFGDVLSRGVAPGPRQSGPGFGFGLESVPTADRLMVKVM